MTVNVNWALIGAILATLAGIAGTILTPLYGTQLATAVQVSIPSLSALLIAIPPYHVASVAAATSKMKAALKMGIAPKSVPSL